MDDLTKNSLTIKEGHTLLAKLSRTLCIQKRGKALHINKQPSQHRYDNILQGTKLDLTIKWRKKTAHCPNPT